MLRRFNLPVDIGTGVATHHLLQPLGRDPGLGVFVTPPRCYDCRVQVVSPFRPLAELLAIG
jgi:hypothetical protein